MSMATKARAPATAPIKGRGAASYVPGRYEATTIEACDDGWDARDPGDDTAPAPHPDTRVHEEAARGIISRNQSPDLGFDQSINPYRGCEHGCVYCYARPSHAWMNLSPGLDFETRLFAKTNAAERLRAELSRKGYRCSPIALGVNTDAYQPIERRYRITRELIEVLAEFRHPFRLVTKSALVQRDLDLLAPLAAQGLVNAHVSVTTLDNRLSARMEPRACAPHTRLRTIRALADAGVPVGVLVAPVVPAITDHELESILEAAHEAGARAAGYVLLRLPHELGEIWKEWLQLHFPDRAAHVMSLVRQMRGGRDYDGGFGRRMQGQGPFAQLLAQRFARTRRRLGFPGLPPLDTSAFGVPPAPGAQGQLF
jgi:DNA repair photolyase